MRTNKPKSLYFLLEIRPSDIKQLTFMDHPWMNKTFIKGFTT